MVVVALLIASFSVVPAYAALSDAQAVSLARSIWGDSAQVSKTRVFGDTNWTFSVGFKSPGCATDFTVLGSALNDWDSAFALVPNNTSPPPFSGQAVLQVQSGGSPPAPLTVFQAFVTTFQFLLDGKPLGVPLAVPALVNPTDPWSLTSPWDTTLVPDGFHVLCGQWQDASGNIGPVHATMVVVKQAAPVAPATAGAKIATAFPPAGANADLR